jgi:hypothetical protein
MKRLALCLAAVCALVALIAPASSTAGLLPPYQKFEIIGNANGPKITSSLGSCSIAKIAGSVPPGPAGHGEKLIPVTLTAGACSAGTSITFAGEWQISANGWSVALTNGYFESIVMRFASLPGCKLISVGAPLWGIWSNGVYGEFSSGYHPHGVVPMRWENDGGSCSLARQIENLAFEDQGTTAASGAVSEVKNLSSSQPITSNPY